MTDFNVTVEVAVAPAPKRVAVWMDELASYSPAVSRTDRGRSEVTITLPAKSLEQAIATGLAVLAGAVGQVERLEVLTTAEFDRRVDDIVMPELIGASEAAELLGVTRQRVQQLAASGAVPAMKIGKSLVLPRHTIVAMASKANVTPS